jgi:hypothetical protein
MDKETYAVKADELNKLTKRAYWAALFAILIGLVTVLLIRSISGSWYWDSLGISLGSLGIILGITSLILATTARIIATTTIKSRRRISFTMAKAGLWLSIVTIIVLVIAWAVFILALFIPNPAND